ncbi:NAD-dependent epimerase/dehydratase family protein [Agromyces sp. LHK192]|uniref:NAD-dependent epimerase/dehydratase family protein n=1 Tax=Agromyces sp. LHK192 TaxID=2498704 RepID=UPI000FD847AB|nr:NAD-dependent epimerase/dehydratase family protein [Agromyces sp. LHK192]
MRERVLITGGAGFIGTALSRRLLAAGHEVRVLDSLDPHVHGSAGADALWSGSLPLDVDFMHGSVLVARDLQRALDGTTIVIHLAGERGTGRSGSEIDRCVETNARGTAVLLDQLATSRRTVHRLVVASSRAVYGEGAYATEDGRTLFPAGRSAVDLAAGDFDVHVEGEGRLRSIPTPETAPVLPTGVYGITKHVQESLVMTVAPTLGIVPVVLRFQNVYGPGQSLTNPHAGLASRFANLIRRGKRVEVFEDGDGSRDFLYIDDAVEAAFVSAVSPMASGVYNVGSGSATTVSEAVRVLSAALGRPNEVRASGDYRMGDSRHSVADIRRIGALGWAPRIRFEEGMRTFARWVLDQPRGDAAGVEPLRDLGLRGLLAPERSVREIVDPGTIAAEYLAAG